MSNSPNPNLPGGSQDKPSDRLSGTGADVGKPDAGKNSSQASDRLSEELSLTKFNQPQEKDQATFTFKDGQIPKFQIRKGEFLHEKTELSLTEIKPFVDDLIKKTTRRDEDKLTESQRQELAESRKNLQTSARPDDAVLHSLHLASLFAHLGYIEEARQATELSLGIDPDNIKGIELFKELERMHPHDITLSAKQMGTPLLSKSNLRKRIKNLTGGRVIVVGDLLLDELLEGKPERISREAPVLILEHVDTEYALGGAANTANNVAHLGGTCHAIGVCGKDSYAQKMAKIFEQSGITFDLVTDAERPTTVKTRILSKAHSFKQQILRLDRISHEAISQSIEKELIEKIEKSSAGYHAIILSDYRGGTMTDGLIKACRQLSQKTKIALIVDAQDHFERFQNVTLITPNQPDCEKACGFTISDSASLKEAGNELMLLTGAEALLITRGGHGMALFQRGQEPFELPVFNREEVFDVTGAGDTVVATMALAMVTGASYIEAMALGNLAAGIVVKKAGTATTSQTEMSEALDQINLPE
jgi:rfaE bifunctional protein kinase chain/domain